MPLADYYERNFLSASQLIQGHDKKSLENVLNNHIVGIIFDSSAAKSREGIAAIDMTVRLLARFYPSLAIIPTSRSAEPLAQKMSRLARSINPHISITKKAKSPTCSLVFGQAKALRYCSGPIFYVGSRGWIARLSSKHPVGSGNSFNRLGAGVAACFAAANIFRVIFSNKNNTFAIDENINLSLLNLAPSKSPANSKALKNIDIGEVHLVGLGAIGNGALWALSNMPVSGKIHLIDNESLELSNLQRYVMCSVAHVGKDKADIARRLIGSKALTACPHVMTWDQYMHSRNDEWDVDCVATALDSAAARIGVQTALPKWIVNGWTQKSEIGISRHEFLGKEACLACIYIPKGVVPNEADKVASALNLQNEIIEVRKRLQLNTPNDRAYLRKIAKLNDLEFEQIEKFENRPLRELYNEGVCGGTVLNLKQGKSDANVEVPMPFQSALAGIILVAEIIIRSTNSRLVNIPNITRINLLKNLGHRISWKRQKDPNSKCICQDSDYIEVYKNKYETP